PLEPEAPDGERRQAEAIERTEAEGHVAGQWRVTEWDGLRITRWKGARRDRALVRLRGRGIARSSLIGLLWARFERGGARIDENRTLRALDEVRPDGARSPRTAIAPARGWRRARADSNDSRTHHERIPINGRHRVAKPRPRGGVLEGAEQLGPLGTRRPARHAQPHHGGEAGRGPAADQEGASRVPRARRGAAAGVHVPCDVSLEARARRRGPGPLRHGVPRLLDHPRGRALPRRLGRRDLQRTAVRRELGPRGRDVVPDRSDLHARDHDARRPARRRGGPPPPRRGPRTARGAPGAGRDRPPRRRAGRGPPPPGPGRVRPRP